MASGLSFRPLRSLAPSPCKCGVDMGFGKGHHLHLIDGSAFIFRAYHALPPLTRRSDGLPVGAVLGFCNMLFKQVEEAKGDNAPTHVAAIFDHKGKTFRNDIYDKYKANRPPAPEDLVPQFPLTRDATRAFNIACVEVEGFEADDIIATLSCRARDAGGRVTIISSDKDMMQLVGGGVEMLDVMKNKRIDRDGVFEKFGVGPERVVDVQALAGDSVDNVPGAPGIYQEKIRLHQRKTRLKDRAAWVEDANTGARGHANDLHRQQLNGLQAAMKGPNHAT